MKRILLFGLLISLILACLAPGEILPAQAQSFHPGFPMAANTATSTPTFATPTRSPSPTPTLQPSQTPTLQPSQTPTLPASYIRPLLNLVTNSYDNAKAYAGGRFTLNSKFKNLGQTAAYNVIITFVSTDMLPQTNGGVEMITQLNPGESVTISQEFLIKNSIATYQALTDILVEYKDESGTAYTQKFSASVNVYWNIRASVTPTPTPTTTVVGRPQIVVKAYQTDKATLQPGSSFTLTLNVQNLGGIEARSVILTMNSSVGAGGTTATQFLPVGSSNVRVIENMPPQKELQIQQNFIVNSSTAPGVYPITLNFAYKDPAGASLNDEQIITLLVYLVPSVDIGYYKAPGLYTPDRKAILPLQVVNLSSTSVLLGDLMVSSDSIPLTNNRTFVGTLEGGGNFTLDAEFIPKQAGEQTFNVTITYQDNFKVLQTITKNLTVTVKEPVGSELPTSSGQSASKDGKTPTNLPNAPESFGQILLRFIRGMIGFGSAPIG